MARTPAQAKALEAKALAADSKSEGMRMLFEADYTVLEVKDILGVPYGFAYGVAKRGGFVEATPREPKAKAAPKAKAPAKAAPKPAAKKATAKAPAKKVAAKA